MFEWFTKRKKIDKLEFYVEHWHDAYKTSEDKAEYLSDCLADLTKRLEDLRADKDEVDAKYKKLFKRIDSEGWYNRVNPKYVFDNVSTIYPEKPTKEDRGGIWIEVPQKRVALKFDIDPKMLDIYLDYVLEDVENDFKNMFLNKVLPQFIDRIREANKK